MALEAVWGEREGDVIGVVLPSSGITGQGSAVSIFWQFAPILLNLDVHRRRSWTSEDDAGIRARPHGSRIRITRGPKGKIDMSTSSGGKRLAGWFNMPVR